MSGILLGFAFFLGLCFHLFCQRLFLFQEQVFYVSVCCTLSRLILFYSGRFNLSNPEKIKVTVMINISAFPETGPAAPTAEEVAL